MILNDIDKTEIRIRHVVSYNLNVDICLKINQLELSIINDSGNSEHLTYIKLQDATNDILRINDKMIKIQEIEND